MLSCMFNPGACLSQGLSSFADAFLSLFPFGMLGLVFFAGLVVGERLGKWGVLAVILGWITYRFGSSVGKDTPDPVEHFERHPDHAQAPIHRTGRGEPRVILRTAKRSGKHRTLEELFKSFRK